MANKNDKNITAEQILKSLGKAFTDKYNGYIYESPNTAPEQLDGIYDFTEILRELPPEEIETFLNDYVETKESNAEEDATVIGDDFQDNI